MTERVAKTTAYKSSSCRFFIHQHCRQLNRFSFSFWLKQHSTHFYYCENKIVAIVFKRIKNISDFIFFSNMLLVFVFSHFLYHTCNSCHDFLCLFCSYILIFCLTNEQLLLSVKNQYCQSSKRTKLKDFYIDA